MILQNVLPEGGSLRCREQRIRPWTLVARSEGIYLITWSGRTSNIDDRATFSLGLCMGGPFAFGRRGVHPREYAARDVLRAINGRRPHTDFARQDSM